jgi:predicted protein tyrosine phosphatase
VLYICSWQTMEERATELGATHVLSLLGVEGVPRTPDGIDRDRHLHLEVDDVVQPFAGYIAPSLEHVEEILDFADRWNRDGPMMVHCYAGVSRSTAAALTILCLYNEGREEQAARQLRALAPHAKPNRRIVAIADRAMGLDGRMVRAVEALPPAEHYGLEGPLVALPIDLP